MYCTVKIPLDNDEIMFVATEIKYTPEQKETWKCEHLLENIAVVEGYVLGTDENFSAIYDFFMDEITEELLKWYHREEER